MSEIVTTYGKNGNVVTGSKKGTTVWKSGAPKSETVRVNGDVVTVGGVRIR
jgi:hypothetical protein